MKKTITLAFIFLFFVGCVTIPDIRFYLYQIEIKKSESNQAWSRARSYANRIAFEYECQHRIITGKRPLYKKYHFSITDETTIKFFFTVEKTVETNVGGTQSDKSIDEFLIDILITREFGEKEDLIKITPYFDMTPPPPTREYNDNSKKAILDLIKNRINDLIQYIKTGQSKYMEVNEIKINK